MARVDGPRRAIALAGGLAGILVVLVLRRLWPAVPGVMVAVVVGIAAVALLDLDEEGVQVLGVLPRGLPAPAFPSVELPGLGALFSGALGAANLAAGLFQGFPTIGTAVDAYLEATGTAWVDWEERPDPVGGRPDGPGADG